MKPTTAAGLSQHRFANTETRQLCAEFFRLTPIKWFSYGRFSSDRNLSVLMSDSLVCEFCSLNKVILPHYIHGDYDAIPNKAFFVSLLTSSNRQEGNFYKLMSDQFGLDNFFRFFRRGKLHCDIYTFATNSTDGDMLNYYINNQSQLEKYIEVIHPTLQRIMMDNAIKGFHVAKTQGGFPMTNMGGNFAEIIDQTIALDIFRRKKSATENRFLGCLSKREFEVLHLIVRGHSAKEIGQVLSLSFRTVENYSQNIRHKLGCRSKSDVLIRYSNKV